MSVSMVRRRIPRNGFASVLSAALVLAVLGFASGASAGTAGTMSYTDPAADAEGGPDVTGATIRGDAAPGQIAFSVTALGYPLSVQDGLERYVEVWVDTDRNGATGDPEDGADVGLQAWVDQSGRWWSASRWNGTEYEAIPQSATTTFSRNGDVLTWTLSTADLGSASFRFYVLAGTWNDAEKRSVARDDAPDRGWWEYDISASTPPPSKPPTTSAKLLIGTPKASPKAPAAGTRFTLRYDVKVQKTESATVVDITTGETRESVIVTWQPLARGTVVARASIAGRAIPLTVSLRNGALRLSIVVPKTAKGKLIRVPVKIGATDSGKVLSATRVVTFRVK